MVLDGTYGRSKVCATKRRFLSKPLYKLADVNSKVSAEASIESGYIYDEVKAAGRNAGRVKADGSLTLKLYYSIDTWNDSNDSDEEGDNIPDNQQIRIVYKPESDAKGSVDNALEVATIGSDIEWKGSTAAAAVGYEFVQWVENTSVKSTSEKYEPFIEDPIGGQTYTYTAQFSAIQYTVTFKDYDDTVISVKTDYHCGDTVAVPADPTRDADAENTYIFAAWTPEVAATVAGSAEYTAVYTCIPKDALYYTVEYYKDDVKVSSDTITVKMEKGSTQLAIQNDIDASSNKFVGYALDDTAPAPLPGKGDLVANGTVIKVYYSTDKLGQGKDADTEQPDGIPDKYQITVLYKSEKGGKVVGIQKEVITLENSESYVAKCNIEASGSEVVRDRSKYKFDGWYADSVACKLKNAGKKKLSAFWIEDAEGGKIYTITADFDKKTANRDDGTNIDDSRIPAGLNTEEHFRYIVGDDNGNVRPLDDITRAEVAVIFYRLLKDEVREQYFATESDFPDLHEGLWYNKAAATLVNAGIFTGCDDGLFHGERSITRAELATVIAKFDNHVYLGEDLFDDISKHWGRAFINACASNGWIVGDGSGKFRPYELITRAEVMTMINAVLQRSVDEEGLCEGYKQWPDNTPGTWYYYQIIEATNYHTYERERDWTEDWIEILPDKIWDESGS